MPRVVFAFFGHPGAGKTTLCRRFGELHGLPAIDTDVFMTAAERDAVHEGRYTQAMRLANIERYCGRITSRFAAEPAVAIADGLPNDAARRYLQEQLGGAAVVLVLVQTPRALWEQRLADRGANPVDIDVASADQYVLENWEDVAADQAVEVIENGADPAAIDAALKALFLRHAP